MPDNKYATYSVKRNSLSSKWGVWATETESGSPVENLLAEFKNSEDAATYCERTEAGESHAAIIAELSDKKRPSKNGGGMFGKLFKRGSAANGAHGDGPVVNNPVIEIQAPVRRSPGTADEPALPAEPVAQPATRAPAPSRFQLIEQPAPEPVAPRTQPVIAEQPAPVAEEVTEPVAEEVTGEKTPEVTAEVPETVQAPAEEAPVEEPPVIETAEPVEAVVEPEPVADETAPAAEHLVPGVEVVAKTEPVQVEDVQPVETAAPASAEQPVQPAPVEPVTRSEKARVPEVAKAIERPAPEVARNEPSRDEGLLVDWTFTPPPDVTPEEVRTAGSAANHLPAEDQAQNGIDPEWTTPARSAVRQPAPATPAPAMNVEPGGRRITVDICVTKSLKESATGDPKVSDKKYNSIASKEYTEVSKAFASGNSPVHLRDELTHLAAVCLAWAEAIDKREGSADGEIAA